jgi:hypothetical protein
MTEPHVDQLEMLPIAEWRRAVREALITNEADRRELTERLAALTEERERLLEEEQLITHAVRAYNARLHAPSTRSPIAGDTLREVLIINFANSEGVIIGNDAVAALCDIGYFSNRRTADGATYTVLSKPPFEKIDRGIYRIPTDSPEWIYLRGANGHTSTPDSPKDGRHDEQVTVQNPQEENPKPLRKARIDAVVSEAVKLGGFISASQAVHALEDV